MLEEGFFYRGITLSKAEPEYSKGLDGFADIVIFDKRYRPWLVVEAKKRVAGYYSRNFDPFSPIVVRQAHRYASQLGAPYFATYNGDILVLFRTIEKFVPLLQRKTKSYLVKDVEKFASRLLFEVIDLEKGIRLWDPREDAFVTRLEEFHKRLSTQFSTLLANKLRSDKRFSQQFRRWLRDQGWESNEKVHQNFARQAAYLLMNKLIFYKILQNEPAYSDNIPALDLKPAEISNQLRMTFDEVVRNIDFEAVFEQDPIFDQVPLNKTTNEELREFLKELEGYNFSEFGSDVIGRIYQNVIPPEERHDLGQYYTPPQICELVVHLTVKDPDSHVLDPAVGSGGFVVKAYERLKTLKRESGMPIDHKEIVSQIHGVDINRFPAHLTAINLTLRDLNSKTENVDVEVSDFFDLKPRQKRMQVERALARGRSLVEMVAPAKVDAVVGNPPYIRQEKIGNKGKVRKHLHKLGYDDMSDRADIYCYFFTHSTEFLKEGGNLGFITSNRWLTVGYGKDLQAFFLRNCKIKAIIAFDKQVFKEPLIGTVITILEKCAEESNRDSNVVGFFRFKRRLDLETIIKRVQTNYKPDLFYEDAELRLVTMQQRDLRREDKWYKYLYAPTIYFKCSSHKKVVPLENVADVSRGITSNANRFFYFRGKKAFEDWGIHEKFVSPLVKHVRQTEFIEIGKKDTDWFVLDLHGIVQEILSSEDKTLTEHLEPAEIVKRGFVNRGFHGLSDYIEHGEKIGINRRPALRSRKIWFDLGHLPRPPIMFPEVYWKKAQVLSNTDGLTLDKRLYSIWPKKNSDPVVLLGILNSGVLLMMREIDGRVEEGQAMNRNSVMVYEAKNLKILDPRKLSKREASRIKKAFQELVEKEHRCNKQELNKLHEELDKAVLAPLGMEEKAKELRTTVEALLQARIVGGGMHAEVIIGTEKSEREEIMRIRSRISGEEAMRVERITLDDFID